MKTVFSNPQDIAHLWANQSQQEAKNSNRSFYFYGPTIYSYGSHFPIAKHYEGILLFTLNSYSVTTAKHIQIVRGASSHINKVYCFELPSSKSDKYSHEKNISQWIRSIKSEIEKLPKSRKPEIYIGNINGHISNLKKYVSLFGIKLNSEQKKIISIESKEDFLKLMQKDIEAKELFKKQIQTKGKALYNKYIDAWRTYNESELKKALTDKQSKLLSDYRNTLDLNKTFLRFNEVEIQTSKDVKIPLEVARRFYMWFVSVKSKGCVNCEKDILGYPVKSANESGLIVGCHDVPIAEINRIAAILNW